MVAFGKHPRYDHAPVDSGVIVQFERLICKRSSRAIEVYAMLQGSHKALRPTLVGERRHFKLCGRSLRKKQRARAHAAPLTRRKVGVLNDYAVALERIA